MAARTYLYYIHIYHIIHIYIHIPIYVKQKNIFNKYFRRIYTVANFRAVLLYILKLIEIAGFNYQIRIVRVMKIRKISNKIKKKFKERNKRKWRDLHLSDNINICYL